MKAKCAYRDTTRIYDKRLVFPNEAGTHIKGLRKAKLDPARPHIESVLAEKGHD